MGFIKTHGPFIAIIFGSGILIGAAALLAANASLTPTTTFTTELQKGKEYMAAPIGIDATLLPVASFAIILGAPVGVIGAVVAGTAKYGQGEKIAGGSILATIGLFATTMGIALIVLGKTGTDAWGFRADIKDWVQSQTIYPGMIPDPTIASRIDLVGKAASAIGGALTIFGLGSLFLTRKKPPEVELTSAPQP
jgi:hypothetical protein